MEIRVADNNFCTKLYDKRDDFPITIVRLPHRTSTIPSTMFYSSFGAEVLRIARVTSSLDTFCPSLTLLVARIKEQGGRAKRMRRVLGRTYAKHPDSFQHLLNDPTILLSVVI